MNLLRLPTVVACEAVSSHGDRVRCVPFAQVVTAAKCLDRQRAALREGIAGPHRPCRLCVDGVLVAARLGEHVEIPAPLPPRGA